MSLSWLWGGQSSARSSDAVKNLDPALQQVLQDQKDVQGRVARRRSSPRPYVEQVENTKETVVQNEIESVAPAQSQFPDGRYAHIWKNYEPLAVVASRGETEADRLRRLSENQQDRKVAVGQAALENCVFEQMAELDCLQNGSLARRTMMCRPEKKKFTRCYEMQLKFLKALGFPGAIQNSERANAIQMHSDLLWQRLVSQEEIIAKAKEAGEPIPSFDSILSDESVKSVGGSLSRIQVPARSSKSGPQGAQPDNYAYSRIPVPFREAFNARISDMNPEDAKVEEAVFLADLEEQRQFTAQGLAYLREEGDARRKRYETGNAGLGDYIKKWSGWDAYDSRFPLPADAKARMDMKAQRDKDKEL